jgi:hypothetical protein
MRDRKTWSVRFGSLLRVALTVGALLAVASPAAARMVPSSATHPIGGWVRAWSVSKIEQGVGKKLIKQAVQRTGVDKVFDLGPAAFNFPLGFPHDRASGFVSAVRSAFGLDSEVQAQAPVLDPFTPRSAKGGVARLDEYQTYEKRCCGGDAFLRVAIPALSLETEDANGPPTPSECPDLARCNPIRTVVRYHALAYLSSGKPGSSSAPPKTPFFNVGGTVYTEGYQRHWFVGAATSSDSGDPFWKDAQFDVNGDVDNDKSGSRSQVRPAPGHAIEFNVPLRSVLFQQRFTVHVTMDAEAIDDRGGESSALALIVDPQHAGPGLIARGLTSLAAATVKEPPIPPRPAARCPSGPRPNAGTVQLSGHVLATGEGSGTALVLVTRSGGSRGAASAVVSTSGGSARSGRDFTLTRTLVRFENGDTSPRLVEIPIREDLAVERPESFTVSLSHLRCAGLGARRSASVTILDDDQPPPTPPPAFTVGGTVDGLAGVRAGAHEPRYCAAGVGQRQLYLPRDGFGRAALPG